VKEIAMTRALVLAAAVLLLTACGGMADPTPSKPVRSCRQYKCDCIVYDENTLEPVMYVEEEPFTVCSADVFNEASEACSRSGRPCWCGSCSK